MDENIITWNTTNWVTISIMAGLTFIGLGFLQSWWVRRQQAS
jgi:hypothetical protein